MNSNIRDIITKAEDLSKKISSLQNEKSLPIIELDIILLDIRTLYEDIKNLQQKSSRDVPHKLETDEKTRALTPEKEVSETGTQTDEVPADAVIEEKAPEKEVPETGTQTDEVPADDATEEEAPEKEVPETQSDEKSPGQTTLADRYKSDKKFINESFAGNLGNNDISSKIQSKPIENIGSALGINDRFKLINDLFNGDKTSFQNTITILNDSPNFNEAFNYITSSFDWDMEEESVQLLLDLVRRKFIVNQNE